MNRPKCRRCGGPLDFWYDPDTGRYRWVCNNPRPIRDDAEHERAWADLPGDDVARLEMTA